MPTYSLLSAPPSLTTQLQCTKNAPLPLIQKLNKFAASVVCLAPFIFRAETLDQ